MNTHNRLVISASFSLADKAAADAIETKIQTFVDNQADASRVNRVIDRPDRVDLETQITVNISSAAELKAALETVETALDATPELTAYRAKLSRQYVAPVVEVPPEDPETL
jgi:CBS domain containing-hemolysin-like protein